MNNDCPTPPRSPVKLDTQLEKLTINDSKPVTKQEIDFFIEDIIGMSKEKFESLTVEEQLTIVNEKIIKPSTVDPSLH